MIQAAGSDTGMFAEYGRLLLAGARPYVDFWDLHPPVVFWFWELAQILGGTDWLRSCLPINGLAFQSCPLVVGQTLDLVLSVAAAVTTAAITRSAGARFSVAALAGLLTVTVSNLQMLSLEGGNPSKLTLLPQTLAVLCFFSSWNARNHLQSWFWAVAAGALAGLAVLAKQPALLTFASLLLYAVWRRDPARAVGLACGCVALVALTCLWLASKGALESFWREAWVYNVQRTFSGYWTAPDKPPAVRVDTVFWGAAGLPLLILAAGGLLALFQKRRAGDQGVDLLIVWALLSFAAVIGLREFIYVVPAVSVLAAFGWGGLWQYLGRYAPRPRLVLRLLAALLFLVAAQRTTLPQAQFLARTRNERGPGGGLSQAEELARILRRDLPGGSMFVYGNAGNLYPLADRPPATPYLNAEALRADAPDAANTRSALLRELQQAPPEVVVLPPHSDEKDLAVSEFPALELFLNSCYSRHSINSAMDHFWTVLERSPDCVPRPAV